MNVISRFLLSLIILSSLLPFYASAEVRVGVGKSDITPPIGTPSAGYFEREGSGMQGVHDPLFATAIVIDNGEKMIALCSVDHMGFISEMAQEVIQKAHSNPGLAKCEIYIGSSHTHSGGGAYFNIPIVGEMVAGPYNADTANFYIDNTVKAILDAHKNLQPAKIGMGYGQSNSLTTYNGVWPTEMKAPCDLSVIKVTKLDGSPLAVVFNNPIYPAVLDGNNMLFSADVIGYTRNHIRSLIGEVTSIFFNGAIGDIDTNVPYPNDQFKSCDLVGKSLAESVYKTWNSTETANTIAITTSRDSYWFESKPTLSRFQIPVEKCLSEINLIVLNKTHAFITIPAELSCTYDSILKEKAKTLGFLHLSILGLVNDAHGYIYSPEAWRRNPPESDFSYGGEMYGQVVEEKITKLMQQSSPLKTK